MAVKTFTTGEVLTAADANTYLNNGGLVYVTSATVGSAVSTVTVSNCFSSTYDNYKVIYSGGTVSSADRIDMRIGSATTGYYLWMVYGNYAGGSATPIGSGITNQPYAYWVGGGDTNAAIADFELYGPNLAKYTYYRNNGLYFAQQGGGWMTGRLQDTTQHTSVTLSTGGATFTGGTITVYGYRKA